LGDAHRPERITRCDTIAFDVRAAAFLHAAAADVHPFSPDGASMIISIPDDYHGVVAGLDVLSLHVSAHARHESHCQVGRPGRDEVRCAAREHRAQRVKLVIPRVLR
jgi:ribonucleotide reductase alpha subunit